MGLFLGRRIFAIALAQCCIVTSLLLAQDGTDDFTRGKAALDAKHYAEAEEAFARAEAESPGTTTALALRAKALIQLNRFDEARHCLDEYLKNHPSSVDAKYLLAYVLFRRNLPSESLGMYTAAAVLQRPTAGDLKIVGLDYVLLNDYPDAVQWLERSVAEDPKDPEAVYYLGRGYYVQNNFDKAIAAFEQALQLDATDAKAENNLGLAFAAKSEPKLAEAAYRKSIQMGEGSRYKSDQPYINLAELLNHSDRQTEALSLLDQAEQIGGKTEREQQLRGQILLDQNRLPEAETSFRVAVSMNPNSGALHYLLGRVLKREGKSDDAEKEFAKSKVLDGNRSSAPN